MTLTHEGESYPGTIAADGTFATTPVPVVVGSDTHTLTIGGRFSTTGFNGIVTAEVTRSGGPTCGYVVNWVATRRDGVNVIPG